MIESYTIQLLFIANANTPCHPTHEPYTVHECSSPLYPIQQKALLVRRSKETHIDSTRLGSAG